MCDQSLNVAVVGLGVGEQHARTFMSEPRTNLKVIVEHHDEKAQEYITDNALEDVHILSLEEVINNPSIDIVSLASFDHHHADQVVACLKAGKHVFVEKPLCTTSEELEEIQKVWEQSNCALMSNLVLRKAPLYEWLQKAVQDGDLGDIYALDGDYLYGRLHKVTDGWRTDVDDYSVMKGGGIHIIDIMLSLFESLPISVQSSSNKIVTKDTAFRYHDFHSAEFTFETGAIARITANYGCVHQHQHVLRIFGTKGTFIFDDQGARLHTGRDNAPEIIKIDHNPLPDGKGVLIPAFINSISHKDFKESALREFNLMKVVLAADKALGYKGPQNIAY